ncbi:MAG: hypothetical protein HFH89_09005 [Lachnospiraceae bacterium]|nr:hypothetical protein [uncultured Acetatifactor sp.]MCI8287773.1 hypothetical protein [Lachnospiraceae bacterium]
MMAIMKRIYGMTAGVLMAAALTGCGDGTDEVVSESSISVVEAVTITNEPVNAEPESQESLPAEKELMYSSGQLTAEEEDEIQEAMKTLYQNLEVPEYVGEGIHMVSSAEWEETMSHRLYEGCRSYTLQEGERMLLSVHVGYDIPGNFYANICYLGEDDSLILLKQADGITWIMQTGVSEGEYNGAFEIWLIDSKSGHIVKETGTYSKGVIVGEYTKSEYTGAAGEAFDLWTNREGFSYETTTVNYDEQGEIVPTPTPVPTATPTPKPTNKPAVTSKPVKTPTPTQAPTPEPQPEPEPDPEPDPQPDPQPTPEPPQEPAPPSAGGDTDIEWSPDLM